MAYNSPAEFIACPKVRCDLVAQSQYIMTCLIKDSVLSQIVSDKRTSGLLRFDYTLGKTAGSKLRMRRSGPLKGLGVTDCETLVGKEECPNDDMEEMEIHALRHAECLLKCGFWEYQKEGFVRTRDQALVQLKDWLLKMIMRSFFNQLGGYTGAYTYYDGERLPLVKQLRGMNLVTAPTAHYKVVTTPASGTTPASSALVNIAGNPAGEAAIAEKDKFTMSALKQLVPLMFSDNNICGTQKLNEYGVKYVLFLHPTQLADLKADPEWKSWICCADEKGDKNRLTTGAEGIIDGILIKTSDMVPYGVNADGTPNLNVRRAILAGVNAAVLAIGGFKMRTDGKVAQNVPFALEYETFDYKWKTDLALAAIWGLKKNTFNGKDTSVMVIPTYAASNFTPPSNFVNINTDSHKVEPSKVAAVKKGK